MFKGDTGFRVSFFLYVACVQVGTSSIDSCSPGMGCLKLVSQCTASVFLIPFGSAFVPMLHKGKRRYLHVQGLSLDS